jgi:hypothetical protein
VEKLDASTHDETEFQQKKKGEREASDFTQ